MINAINNNTVKHFKWKNLFKTQLNQPIQLIGHNLNIIKDTKSA